MQYNFCIGFIAPSTGAVYQGNNSTAWTATSDRRIKKDIKPSEKGLKEINQLVPCTFFYKSDEELKTKHYHKKEQKHIFKYLLIQWDL